ncbi:MAG: Rpn family recombination-promoting nuclease/putative transposase [Lachnospiraceae bacterium]|nr:Rpn family recombination-promoting nuclease/putative transposase [Lachnospiraceae bacterium]
MTQTTTQTTADNNYIMHPTVDYCFKELMNNAKVRKGFVAALLRVKPETIEGTSLLPTSLSRASENDKLGILDVLVLLTDGTRIDMEMQVATFLAWQNRILFYLCKMYTDQLKKGEDYSKIKKCIHVSILDFNHFPDGEECCRTIHLHDSKTHALYSDLLEIQILELKKLPKELPDDNDVLSWMRFFSGKKKEDFQAMAGKNEYLDEAYNTLLELSADEKKRLEYEAREKALRDYNFGMNCARKEGEQVGEERGIAIGKERGIAIGEKRGIAIGNEQRDRELIITWTKQGRSDSEIAELLNLSEDAVRKVQVEEQIE